MYEIFETRTLETCKTGYPTEIAARVAAAQISLNHRARKTKTQTKPKFFVKERRNKRRST